jgi:hypothetical protein
LGQLLRMPTTDARQALARFREEAEAFRLVLRTLVQWRGGDNDVFLKLFGLYRARMRMMRSLARGLLDRVEEPNVVDELRLFAQQRDP